MKKILTAFIAPVAILAFVSCSSTPPGETTTSETYEKGVPGRVIVETYKITATVASVDSTNRTVTLATRDGKQETIRCGPEILNFDQIHTGDQVKVRATSELAVAMADANDSSVPSGARLIALAPKGAKPAGLMAETQEYTATVTAIGLKRHEATFELPDGSTRKFAVRKDVDLTQRKVGEKVLIRVTVATALSVEKP